MNVKVLVKLDNKRSLRRNDQQKDTVVVLPSLEYFHEHDCVIGSLIY